MAAGKRYSPGHDSGGGCDHQRSGPTAPATCPADLKNVCLEATLLHVRLLIEFLACRPSKDGRSRHRTDIEPLDFVREWKEPVVLDGYLDLADKHLAHLTLERATTVAARTWALARLIDAVLLEFQRFVDVAKREPSVFAQTFRAALVEAMHRKSHPPVVWPDLPPRPRMAANIQIVDRF